MPTTYFDFLINRIEDLAQEIYYKTYDELTLDVQLKLWNQAEADWINRQVAAADYTMEK